MHRKLQKLQKLIILLLAFCITAGTAVPAFADGPTDVSDKVDVSITTNIENNTVEAWNAFNVRVEMKENGLYEVQPNDSVTVTWDSNMRSNYTGDLDVVIESGDLAGTSIGTAHITASGATIVFNDNVNKAQQVGAYVQFKCYATTTGGHTIQSGKTSYTYEATYNQGVVGPVSKDGVWVDAPDYTVIRWLVRVNQKYTADWGDTVTITDTLSADLGAPEQGTFHLAFYSDDKNNVVTLNSVDELTTLGGSFSYNESTRKITCTFPGSWLNTGITKDGTTYNGPLKAILIYQTKTTGGIDDEGHLYKNTAVVTNNGQEMPAEGNMRRPSASAGGSGIPMGTIQITKTVTNTTDPVPGVKFYVYKLDENGTEISGWYNGADYAEMTTGDDGIAKLSNLTNGKYKVKEISAPNWVVISTQETPVELTGDSGADVKISNPLKTTSVTVTKRWDDAENQDGVRPDHVVVHLKSSDGTTVLTKTLTAADHWSYTFENLPAYTTSGKEITYTVEEEKVEGYTSSVIPTANGNYDVKNSYIPATVRITLAKKWDDGNNKDGIRPERIHVTLYASGESVDDAYVTAEAGWTFTFENLPKYKNGEEIDYSVVEDNVDGYQNVIDEKATDDGAITFEITNKHEPSKPEKPSEPENSSKPDVPKPTDNVKTGDSSHVALFALLLAGAAVLMSTLLYYRRRKEDRE